MKAFFLRFIPIVYVLMYFGQAVHAHPIDHRAESNIFQYLKCDFGAVEHLSHDTGALISAIPTFARPLQKVAFVAEENTLEDKEENSIELGALIQCIRADLAAIKAALQLCFELQTQVSFSASLPPSYAALPANLYMAYGVIRI